MNKLFEAFANIFRVPDLRKRLLFALGLLAVYRLGGNIPTPGINLQLCEVFFSYNSGSIFGRCDCGCCCDCWGATGAWGCAGWTGASARARGEASVNRASAAPNMGRDKGFRVMVGAPGRGNPGRKSSARSVV